jgi:hypothetical protein
VIHAGSPASADAPALEPGPGADIFLTHAVPQQAATASIAAAAAADSPKLEPGPGADIFLTHAVPQTTSTAGFSAPAAADSPTLAPGAGADIFLTHAVAQAASSPGIAASPADSPALEPGPGADIFLTHAVSEIAPAPSSGTSSGSDFMTSDPLLNFAASGTLGGIDPSPVYVGSGPVADTWSGGSPMHFDTEVPSLADFADAHAVDSSWFSYDWSWFDWGSLAGSSSADWFVV